MPIHVPFNGGNTVSPYLFKISGKKLRSDLPSKLLSPGFHLLPALYRFGSDLLSPSKFLLISICAVLL